MSRETTISRKELARRRETFKGVYGGDSAALSVFAEWIKTFYP